MSRILVIEDEREVRMLLKCALERFGHSVETAEDGVDGVRKFEQGWFDLVITDIRMPGLDGDGVLREIRLSPTGGATPVIGMSGTPWLLDRGPFDHVVAKPFPLASLKGLVERFAKPSRPNPSEEIRPEFRAGAYPR